MFINKLFNYFELIKCFTCRTNILAIYCANKVFLWDVIAVDGLEVDVGSQLPNGPKFGTTSNGILIALFDESGRSHSLKPIINKFQLVLVFSSFVHWYDVSIDFSKLL